MAGKDPNKKCKFPFEYKKVTLLGCTLLGESTSYGKYWCATDDRPDWEFKDYQGYCDENCPKSGNTKGRTKRCLQKNMIDKVAIL